MRFSTPYVACRLRRTARVLTAAILLAATPSLFAGTNVPVPARPTRTNSVPVVAVPTGTNLVPAGKAGATNAAAASASKSNFFSAFRDLPGMFRKWQTSRAFYPAVVGAAVCLGGFFIYQVARSKQKKAAAETPMAAAARVRRGRAKKIHTCNVLHLAPGETQLWQFDARSDGYVLGRQQTSLAGEPLPSGLVTKDWRNLVKRKLNVAWLPSEKVFLRVAQFPRSEFSETVAMAELQLEKLSPMPVAQVVWSLHVLPHTEGSLQTVVLVIVARSVIEEFLGQLEGQGFMADELELPLLDLLRAAPITSDGAWIYPDTQAGRQSALVAWWSGGVLQNLDLVSLNGPNRADSLREQLMQMAWAGELEGWMKQTPRWHLVAEGPVAAEWEAPLREGLDQQVEVSAPLPPSQIASLTARRASHADSESSLLPAEFVVRYQQQFVDRIWMRGLVGVAALYLLGVLVYGAALGVKTFQTERVESQVAALAPSYTNALQLSARYEVLREREELKFASLDCWKLVADLMPPELTLDTWSFGDGKHLTLNGTAPSADMLEVNTFEREMRRATNNQGQPMFDSVENSGTARRPNDTITWGLRCELKRVETL